MKNKTNRKRGFALAQVILASVLVIILAVSCSSPPARPDEESAPATVSADAEGSQNDGGVKIEGYGDGVIEGTVTDSRGNPVKGMRVFINDATTLFPEITARTNEEGYYHLGGLASGTFQVVVHDSTRNQLDLGSVFVEEGETVALDFELTLSSTDSDDLSEE